MRSLLILTLLLAACGGDDTPPPGVDASMGSDSGQMMDAASPPDSSMPEPDTSVPEADAGTPTDAGDAADAGSATDAGILGSDCVEDDECLPAGFCRNKMGGGRECVPFTEEGDRCGGFTPSWAETRCEPGLACIPGTPLIADVPGWCGLIATPDQILANPASYEGRFVGVLAGWILGGPAACTRIGCPVTMPCCNMCNSGERLHQVNDALTPGIQLRDDMSMPFTCTGNECNTTETCTVEAGFEYRVVGTYTPGPGGGYIDVTSAARISFP